MKEENKIQALERQICSLEGGVKALDKHGGIMQISRLLTIMLMSILLITTYGCQKNSTEGEESGQRLAIDETCDAVRNGVRLILAYDSTSSSFIGTVENVTDQTVFSVRVEVHLSNGMELGPTSSVDLAPGDKTSVNLSAAGQSFSWWKAHAETSEGGGEHGGEHETGDEHGGGGEHEGGTD